MFNVVDCSNSMAHDCFVKYGHIRVGIKPAGENLAECQAWINVNMFTCQIDILFLFKIIYLIKVTAARWLMLDALFELKSFTS